MKKPKKHVNENVSAPIQHFLNPTRFKMTIVGVYKTPAEAEAAHKIMLAQAKNDPLCINNYFA